MYLGQCDLTQDQLPAFMATGKQLEIEGLLGDFKDNDELETQEDLKIEIHAQTKKVTNQIEKRDKEVSKTYQETRPSALGMSDPVMEFLEILETQESLSKF